MARSSRTVHRGLNRLPNDPNILDRREAYAASSITRGEYEYMDTMKRSQLANIAFHVQSLAEIIILVVNVGIMFGARVDANEANNNWRLSVLIAFATGVWLLASLPWFFFFFLEKRRPGQDPGRRNIVVVGLEQLYHAGRETWKLKQSLISC